MKPKTTLSTKNREIPDFVNEQDTNLDKVTVQSFGEEWTKFSEFDEKEIESQARGYFDILPKGIPGKDDIIADFGCGSGKFSKYLANRVKEVHSVDPSDAILVADQMLKNFSNAFLYKASISALPFKDETFDFAMSIGVLHHMPNTQKAMQDCVKKVKIGGYFLAYIYYKFDNRGKLFLLIWKLSEIIRKIVSRLPSSIKHLVSDILAIVIYMPLVLLTRSLKLIKLPKSIWMKIPLSAYHDKSVKIIRNDCLDRFGTVLEHRYTKKEIRQMMKNSGLDEIRFSDEPGYWHAIAKRVS